MLPSPGPTPLERPTLFINSLRGRPQVPDAAPEQGQDSAGALQLGAHEGSPELHCGPQFVQEPRLERKQAVRVQPGVSVSPPHHVGHAQAIGAEDGVSVAREHDAPWFIRAGGMLQASIRVQRGEAEAGLSLRAFNMTRPSASCSATVSLGFTISPA